MIRRTLTLPELAMIAGTRAMLGAGVGLLLADRLNKDQRRAVGWTLLGIGVLTTIPLAANVLSRTESPIRSRQESESQDAADASLLAHA